MNNSSLYDEKTFVDIFEQLISKGVKIYIVSREPSEHKNGYNIQAEAAVQWCEMIGIFVLDCDSRYD